MLERTFRAKHMGEALSQIKRELGPDAVILDSREVKLGGAGRVEVTAAAAPVFERPLLGFASPAHEMKVQKLEQSLVRGGVPTNLARTLVMHVRRQLREGTALMVDALAAALRAEVSFARSTDVRTIALVGPTGVGKTTTLAKLSAIASLVERRRVGLVCLDQYRIGASEQLGRYADLIGIPMECAGDARSLDRALSKLASMDMVFVDTAGRSPRDTQGIQATADALEGAREPIEVHLCLSAAMRELELSSTVSRHGVLRPTKLLLTKVDETLHCGGVLGAHAQSGLPLSYLTTGQRVPEDIETASPEALAALLCGGEVQ